MGGGGCGRNGCAMNGKRPNVSCSDRNPRDARSWILLRCLLNEWGRTRWLHWRTQVYLRSKLTKKPGCRPGCSGPCKVSRSPQETHERRRPRSHKVDEGPAATGWRCPWNNPISEGLLVLFSLGKPNVAAEKVAAVEAEVLPTWANRAKMLVPFTVQQRDELAAAGKELYAHHIVALYYAHHSCWLYNGQKVGACIDRKTVSDLFGQRFHEGPDCITGMRHALFLVISNLQPRRTRPHKIYGHRLLYDIAIGVLLCIVVLSIIAEETDEMDVGGCSRWYSHMRSGPRAGRMSHKCCIVKCGPYVSQREIRSNL